jgi:hypothetical protein
MTFVVGNGRDRYEVNSPEQARVVRALAARRFVFGCGEFAVPAATCAEHLYSTHNYASPLHHRSYQGSAISVQRYDLWPSHSHNAVCSVQIAEAAAGAFNLRLVCKSDHLSGS